MVLPQREYAPTPRHIFALQLVGALAGGCVLIYYAPDALTFAAKAILGVIFFTLYVFSGLQG